MKNSAQFMIIVAMLSTVGSMPPATCLASDNNHSFTLEIQSDPEVDSLIQSHDLVKAERLAKEKNLDPRVIATVCALAGKKDEAFAIFSSFVREAPEERKKELAFQSVNLLRNVLGSLSDEFFSHLIDNKIIILSENEMSCAEIALLIRNNRIEEAESKMNLLLDSTYAGNDLVDTAIVLVDRLNVDLRNLEKVRKLLEKLLTKFPENLRVKLQWIASLVPIEPRKALAELENLQKNSPEFYAKHLSIVRLLRGNAFEKIGETDRAKAEFQGLAGHEGLKEIAQDKIGYYEAMERLEQELQEKIAESNKPQYELPPSSPRRWGTIIAINVVFIAIVLYTIYRRKKQ